MLKIGCQGSGSVFALAAATALRGWSAVPARTHHPAGAGPNAAAAAIPRRTRAVEAGRKAPHSLPGESADAGEPAPVGRPVPAASAEPPGLAAFAPGRPAPRSRRGGQTRDGLLAAAREVFGRDGFLGARIADITAAAGVATGSFYTYFQTKEEIFAAVVGDLNEEMLHPDDHPGGLDPVAAIEAANRIYVESYRRNADLMAALEQVSTVNEELARIRARRARAFTERIAGGIGRLQRRGLADPALDPRLTAVALSSMVSRTVYAVHRQGVDVDDDTLVAELTRLWANALRLPAGAGEPGPPAPNSDGSSDTDPGGDPARPAAPNYHGGADPNPASNPAPPGQPTADGTLDRAGRPPDGATKRDRDAR